MPILKAGVRHVDLVRVYEVVSLHDVHVHDEVPAAHPDLDVKVKPIRVGSGENREKQPARDNIEGRGVAGVK